MGRYGQHSALVGGYDLLSEEPSFGLGLDLFDRLGPNLFKDGLGEYEDSTESWAPSGTNTIETSADKAHGGIRSLKISYVDHGGSAILDFSALDDLTVDLVVGKRYRVILWGAMTGGAAVRLLRSDGAVEVAVVNITTSTLTRIEFDFVVQAGVAPYMYMDGFASGEVIYIDSVSIQELGTDPSFTEYVAGGFETDTGSWAVNGTNTIEVSTDKAQSGTKSLKVTYVDNVDGADLSFRDSTDLITDLTVGRKYRVIGWGAVNTGTIKPTIVSGQSGLMITDVSMTSTSMTRFVLDFICEHATSDKLQIESMNPGEIFYLDDISIQEIEEGDLFDLTAGGFETDTGSWAAQGTNTIEVSTDKAHSGSQSLKITWVDTATGALVFLTDAADLITDLTIGKKYRMILWAAVNAASSVQIKVWTGATADLVTTITSESMVRVEWDFIAETGSNPYIVMGDMGAGEIIYIDDVSLQELYTPDYSGRVNHGTVVAGTATPWGYDLNGTSDYIDFGNPSSLQFTDRFTAMCWYNADAWNAWGALLTKTDASFGVEWCIYQPASSGNLRFLVEAGTGIVEITLPSLSAWHHVAGTYFQGTLNLYLDGLWVGTDSGPVVITDNTNNFQIGFQAGGGYFNGKVRDVQLFNRAITQQEVTEEIRRSRYSGGLMNL